MSEDTAQANPSDLIDQYIEKTGDWRGDVLGSVRKVMLAADSGMIEEWKWMGTPTWSCDGLVAVANAHKGKVKVTFNQGAKFADPDGLFNGNDTGATRRSIDIFDPDALDEKALARLVANAIEYNRTHLKKNKGKKN